MASQKQAALTKARERRVALDRNRAARDNRVEQAAAKVFVLLEQHADAETAMQEASAGVSKALRELIGEGLTVDGVAELCELEVGEVRRLLRTAAPAPAETASVTQLRAAAPPGDGGPADGPAVGAAPAAEGEAAGAGRRAE